MLKSKWFITTTQFSPKKKPQFKTYLPCGTDIAELCQNAHKGTNSQASIGDSLARRPMSWGSGVVQKRVKNECSKVGFISVWLQKAEINHSQRVKLACFPCLLYTWKQVHLAPHSIPVAALLGRQRQMVTDYHRLVWQMKNAFINCSHTDLFVSAETKRYTKLVARNPFSFWFPSVFCWCGHETSLITLFFC